MNPRSQFNWHHMLTNKGFTREIVSYKSTVWQRHTPGSDCIDLVERVLSTTSNYLVVNGTEYDMHNMAHRLACAEALEAL